MREKLHHKLRHPGHAFDLKAKEVIGSNQTHCLAANQK